MHFVLRELQLQQENNITPARSCCVLHPSSFPPDAVAALFAWVKSSSSPADPLVTLINLCWSVFRLHPFRGKRERALWGTQCCSQGLDGEEEQKIILLGTNGTTKHRKKWGGGKTSKQPPHATFYRRKHNPELRSGCNPQQIPPTPPSLNAVLTAVPAPRTMLSYKRSSTSAQRNPERRRLQFERIHPSGGDWGGLRENG